APAAPSITQVLDSVGAITGPVAKNGTTDDNDPVISGKGVAGDVVHVMDNGKEIGSTTVSGTGDWSFKPATKLTDGAHDITATQANPATGKLSLPSGDWPFNVDTGAVPVPTISGVTDNVGPVTGPVAVNGTTDDNDPVIAGKGVAGDIVHVMDKGAEIGSTTVMPSGDWSFKPTIPLADGAHDITATQTNPTTGATSLPSGDFPFKVDTSVPPAPSIGSVTDNVGPIQGPVPAHGTTDDNDPVIAGKGVAGDVVHVMDNGKEIGSTTVDQGGNWSFKPTVPLADGAHDVTATQSNPATGATSGPSQDFPFNVDTTAPNPPRIVQVLDDVGAITGPVAKWGTTDDNDPVINGKGAPGAVVHVMDNDVEIGSTTVDGSGDWSFKPPVKLNDGTHDITATQANPATGKLSGESADWPFTVDTSVPVPVAPTITGVTDNVGPIQGLIPAHGTTDDNDPVITGKGVAGDVVHVMDKGVEIGSTTVTPSGDWSFKPTIPLADGAHDITATQTNPAGGATSLPSADFPFNVDTTAPAAPTITQVLDAVGAVTGPVAKNGSTDDNDPVISGKGVAGDVVHVMDKGVEIGSTTVTPSGDWSFKPAIPLADGAHDITATQANPATGKVSLPSGDWPFNVDTSVPAAPTISGVTDNVGPIQGPVPAHGTTDDNDPVIAGKGVPGDIVHVLDNGVDIGSTTVNPSGDWTFKPTVPLADGPHDITAEQSNPATGATSGPSQDFPFNVDTTTPVAPSITQVLDAVGAVTGPVPKNGSTDDN
ncbi:Ig-like domain-containing protein, partial [Caballeronia sordidicola]|uniref:Ig-like domain-containing protein n=1 Tax=Caballeronia sordidicola TaxID=196367 RepID=UPI00211B69D7